MAKARRSGEHWFDDLPHTTFLIFKGSDSLQSCLPKETHRPLFPDYHGFSFSFQASTCLWSPRPSSTPCVGVKLYIRTNVFWDIEVNVFLRLLQMRWWPSTGCGSCWRRTRSTVRSCVANTNAGGGYFPLQICLLYPLADGFSGFKIVPWSYIVFLTSECAAHHVSLPYELSKLPFACTQLWLLVFFLLVYGVEVLLKISGLGPMAYFSSGWNLWVIT